jgi:hypothetical protein
MMNHDILRAITLKFKLHEIRFLFMEIKFPECQLHCRVGFWCGRGQSEQSGILRPHVAIAEGAVALGRQCRMLQS